MQEKQKKRECVVDDKAAGQMERKCVCAAREKKPLPKHMQRGGNHKFLFINALVQRYT